MKSLRALLSAQGVPGCPHGLKALVPFYTTSPAARRSFGFNSLREVMHALQWPKGFEPASTGEDYPHNDGQTWQNSMQGVAHDDVMWFFTRPQFLETVPFGYGLQDLGDYHFENHSPDVPLGNGQVYFLISGDPDGDGMVRIKLPDGFNHMSALTIQRAGPISFLYIPIQDNDPHTHQPIIVALQVNTGQSVFDGNGRATLTRDGDQGAWCAFDPVASRLYTSDSYYQRHGSTVDVYSIGSATEPEVGRPVPGQDLQLTYLGTITLFEADGLTPASLSNIQGGFITPNRHLYLVIDDHTGIVGFDLITGRRRITIFVDYKVGGGPLYQELEGACLFSNPPAPNIGGDIHVILWENGWASFGQDFWLKHYQVSDPNDRPFI